ncbi:MAG: hypothetical protein ACI9YE_003328 [Psychroserpens sp.]
MLRPFSLFKYINVAIDKFFKRETMSGIKYELLRPVLDQLKLFRKHRINMMLWKKQTTRSIKLCKFGEISVICSVNGKSIISLYLIKNLV